MSGKKNSQKFDTKRKPSKPKPYLMPIEWGGTTYFSKIAGGAKIACVNCKGLKQNYESAVFWYTKAAEAGNEYAQYNLGRCYEFGMGIEKSFEKAIYWYKKAARNGNKNAVKALEHFVRI